MDNNNSNSDYSDKKVWGHIIWNLLHSLVENINDEDFNLYREDYLNLIYSI